MADKTTQLHSGLAYARENARPQRAFGPRLRLAILPVLGLDRAPQKSDLGRAEAWHSVASLRAYHRAHRGGGHGDAMLAFEQMVWRDTHGA